MVDIKNIYYDIHPCNEISYLNYSNTSSLNNLYVYEYKEYSCDYNKNNFEKLEKQMKENYNFLFEKQYKFLDI